MRSSWFKWLLILAVLLVSSGGNAHTFADHAGAHAAPCAAHRHHHEAASRKECCCSCFACPSGLVALVEPVAPHSIAYDLRLAPAPAVPLASRFLTPELDPPRPAALS